MVQLSGLLKGCVGDVSKCHELLLLSKYSHLSNSRLERFKGIVEDYLCI